MLDWSEYIRRNGSLNPAVHLERGFALITTVVNNALGGNAEMKDYMPHARSEDDVEIPLEKALEAWR